MSGLRFCMVTTFYPPYNFGGDGIGIQRFSRALVQRGHQVTVLQDVDAYNVTNKSVEPRVDIANDGVEVVRIRSPLNHLSVLLTHQTGLPVLNAFALRNFFKERSFDVINFHNVSLIGGPGVFKYGSGLKLYMAHEHWLVCPTHVLWRHKRELCTKKQCIRCSFFYRRPPQLWRYFGLLQRQLKFIDAFIAMSEFSRRKHHEFGFIRDMQVVNYFLPNRISNQTTNARLHARPYFLFVGRLERIKGLDDVIPLFKKFHAADFLIAGDGEYASVLKTMASRINRVKFLGHVAPDKLHNYYRHAIALVVPSVCFETFGIILIEAFRQGTPVLARRIGPFPEILERCGGGILFETADELSQAMHRLQIDRSLRSKLARSGYNNFESNWSESAVMPRYLEIIKQTAKAKGYSHIVHALEDERSLNNKSYHK